MSVKTIELTKSQVNTKLDFIDDYIKSQTTSDNSVDPNGNVTNKNICVLQGELNKDIMNQIKHTIIKSNLDKLQQSGIFDDYLEASPNKDIKLSDEYARQVSNMEIYLHDASVIAPYCMSISLFPLVFDNGLRKIGGVGTQPKHLSSFIGQLINLIFLCSAQVAGAVAVPETLVYVDYFAKKDYGKNYLKNKKTRKIVEDQLVNLIYQVNTPAGSRCYQSVFYNLSYYDKYYFEQFFGNLVFPDGSKPEYESVFQLQKFFLDIHLRERRKELLTFPVTNITCLTKNGEILDKRFRDMASEHLAKGSSFFVYMSDSVDSLASCCRLRNSVDVREFSYSLGGSGVQTGSINVITLNFNRLFQNISKEKEDLFGNKLSLENEVKKIQFYQLAYRMYIEKLLDAKLLPVYDAGFVSLDKQFMTVGINGVVEAGSFLGYEINNNSKYIKWVSTQLKTIQDLNDKFKQKYFYIYSFEDEKILINSDLDYISLNDGELVSIKGKDITYNMTLMFNNKKFLVKDIKHNLKVNQEFVPAEGLGVKNKRRDEKDGYVIPEGRECYNSYLYEVEDENISPVDKFLMYGKVCKLMDGGSALHLNLEDHLTAEGYRNLLDLMAKSGANYLGTNVAYTKCNDCGYISIHTRDICEKCGSLNIDYITRVIGYLTPVSKWIFERRKEFKMRHFHKTDFQNKLKTDKNKNESKVILKFQKIKNLISKIKFKKDNK